MADPQKADPKKTAFDAFFALPDEQQKSILSQMPVETRQGMYGSMTDGFTPGQRYRFQRNAGLLPQGEVTGFTETPSGKSSGISFAAVAEPRKRLGEISEEAGQLAQEYQYQGTPTLGINQNLTEEDKKAIRSGTVPPARQRSYIEQIGRGMQSGFFEATGVGAKLAAGLLDPKTAAMMIVAALHPAGRVAAAGYFGYQSSQQMMDALRSGKISPENAQNFLLSLSGYVGSGAMGAEGGRGTAETPAKIKARLQPFARKLTGVEPAVREAVTKEVEKFGKAEAKNTTARQQVIDKYLDEKQNSRFRDEQREFKRQKTNQEIEAENARKVQEREAAVKTRQENVVKSDQQATAARTKVEEVENKVWQAKEQKFTALREQIGADRSGEPTRPPGPIVDAIKAAERTLAPDQQGLFRRMVKMASPDEGELSTLREQVMQGQGMTGTYEALRPEMQAVVDDVVRRYGGDVEQGDPMNWGKLQRMKTATESAMRSPSTSQVMKYALSQVDDAIINQMESIATEKGASQAWQEARDLNRQWREDFHTARGPQGSGSPIAQVLEARDPVYIKKPLMRTDPRGTGDNRAVSTLRKYAQYGGNEAADAVQEMIQTERGVGKEPGPAKQTEPVAPKPNFLSKPAPKLPAKVEAPTVDVQEVTRKAIEARSKNWGSFNARDIGILSSSIILGPMLRILFGRAEENASSLLPTAAISYEAGKFGASRALRSPKVINWLLKMPPEEAAALRKIPGADRIKIIDGLTQEAIQDIKQMNFGSDTSAMAKARAQLGKDADARKVIELAQKIKQESGQTSSYRTVGKPLEANFNIPAETRQLLGPENVAKILAAAGSTQPVVKNRKEALEAVPRP